MTWTELENCFSRAAFHSVSRSRAAVIFPALVLSGALFVFCRALAIGSSGWMGMSLAFLPILLSSAVLLFAGVLVIRIHQREVKHLKVEFKRLVIGSLEGAFTSSFLAIPSLLAYLILWICLGIFFLLNEIPGVGALISTLFSFGPFLVILLSLLLCLFNLAILFFAAPPAALDSLKRVRLARQILQLFIQKPLSSIVLFFLSLIPFLFFGSLLTAAAVLTNITFSLGGKNWTVALEWFFLMLPFMAFLTPSVVFFFNFSAESYHLLYRFQSKGTQKD